MVLYKVGMPMRADCLLLFASSWHNIRRDKSIIPGTQ